MAKKTDRQSEEKRVQREHDMRSMSAESLARALRRAKAKVRDYALCTGFSHFVTLTLSPEKIDRYDDRAIIRRTNDWLKNQVKRRGLAYILVPERHQDGAVHWHGLVNNALPLVDSGTVSGIHDKPARPRSAQQRAAWLDAGGHVVYNIPGWRLGFSTAIPLYGEYQAAVAYVCKYIGKQPEKIGGRWYYSGGDLREPEKEYRRADADGLARLCQMRGAYEFDVKDAGLHFVQVRCHPSQLQEVIPWH